jgi:hypothetical protein
MNHVHYILYFFLDNVSSTSFGCYLHPSSGAQVQRTAIGFVSVENGGFSIKWCGGVCGMDLCVLVSCDIYVLLCVIGCVLVLRGHDVWFLRCRSGHLRLGILVALVTRTFK